MAKSAQCADDCLTLRVENLTLGHYVHNHPGHPHSSLLFRLLGANSTGRHHSRRC
jgi:hypothetical protein